MLQNDSIEHSQYDTNRDMHKTAYTSFWLHYIH